MTEIKLCVTESADAVLVEQISKKLNIKPQDEAEMDDSLYLKVDESGVSLKKGKLEMQGDFSKLLNRVKPGKISQEILLKAAKFKGATKVLKAIDATAGMGEDSFILAAAGFDVTLFEKDPIIGILLEDALRRASRDEELSKIVARMHFMEGDSIEYMRKCKDDIDLIYLDPMFPERTKSGLIKKKFQLLGQLEAPATDGEEMFAAARNVNPVKIVIKRPAKGENLGGIKPHYSIDGKAIRYDCFVFPRS
ncbi:MAG: class I SAM-dependent methyltransferase [Lachnospiraceae bacterium]|nr:class I SAM-dependent methyltransferase [Lachnospiraceae bacterium]